MAHPESRIQFPDGAGATQHQLVIMPSDKDANLDDFNVFALANQVIANADSADEDLRLGDFTVPVALAAGSYRLQVRTSLPAVSSWSAPLDFSYAQVGVPGPVVIL